MGKPTHVHVKGPLARYAVHFEEDLADQGYRSARDQLYAMAQVSRWLASENLDAEDLTAAGVEQFLCWRRAAGYVSSLSLNKMSPLLHYLQGTGVVPTFEPITPMTPVGLLIERYRCYLAEERSLSAPSIRNYTGVARDFLSSLSMNSELDLENMTTARVTEFVLSECRRQKVASAKAMTTRLRSLLRFLYVVGLTSNELAGAVSAPATRRPPPAPCNDVFSTPAGTSSTEANTSSSASTGAPTAPCSVQPTSPIPSSRGGAASVCTSSTPETWGRFRCVRIGVSNRVPKEP